MVYSAASFPQAWETHGGLFWAPPSSTYLQERQLIGHLNEEPAATTIPSVTGAFKTVVCGLFLLEGTYLQVHWPSGIRATAACDTRPLTSAPGCCRAQQPQQVVPLKRPRHARRITGEQHLIAPPASKLSVHLNPPCCRQPAKRWAGGSPSWAASSRAKAAGHAAPQQNHIWLRQSKHMTSHSYFTRCSHSCTSVCHTSHLIL